LCLSGELWLGVGIDDVECPGALGGYPLDRRTE
jgi:hypothetical protein